MDTAPRSGCPINAAVEVLGDPWATLVLRDIMFGNRRHFRELIAGSEEGIATNILASRLKQLVAAGLLTRDDARRGQRAAYSLTEAGIQVLPVMVALGNWGLAHRHGERRLRVRAELLRDGGPELVAAMIDELRELHLGIPRPDPDAPRASDQLRAAYETRAPRRGEQRNRGDVIDCATRPARSTSHVAAQQTARRANSVSSSTPAAPAAPPREHDGQRPRGARRTPAQCRVVALSAASSTSRPAGVRTSSWRRRSSLARWRTTSSRCSSSSSIRPSTVASTPILPAITACEGWSGSLASPSTM